MKLCQCRCDCGKTQHGVCIASLKLKKMTGLTNTVRRNQRRVMRLCAGVTVSSEMVTALCASASSTAQYTMHH